MSDIVQRAQLPCERCGLLATNTVPIVSPDLLNAARPDEISMPCTAIAHDLEGNFLRKVYLISRKNLPGDTRCTLCVCIIAGTVNNTYCEACRILSLIRPGSVAYNLLDQTSTV